ncbi:MAG: hypothetical protein AABZ06_02045 [Bdellovibrionota bacterium]
MYGGLWEKKHRREIHVGMLDMGITIPTKLKPKYDAKSDTDYIELALREGTTTRRERPGGLGLFHTFDHLKQHGGTLTIISGNGQVIRYFKNKKIIRQHNKRRLNGTWCMVRFPLMEKTMS